MRIIQANKPPIWSFDLGRLLRRKTDEVFTKAEREEIAKIKAEITKLREPMRWIDPHFAAEDFERTKLKIKEGPTKELVREAVFYGMMKNRMLNAFELREIEWAINQPLGHYVNTVAKPVTKRLYKTVIEFLKRRLAEAEKHDRETFKVVGVEGDRPESPVLASLKQKIWEAEERLKKEDELGAPHDEFHDLLEDDE